MAYIDDLIITDDSFEDRIGEPTTFDAAVGRLAYGYRYLGITLRKTTRSISRESDYAGASNGTASSDYLVSSLRVFEIALRRRTREGSIRNGDIDFSVWLDELVAACAKMDKIYNSVIDIVGDPEEQETRAHSGMRELHSLVPGIGSAESALSAEQVLDMSDYCVMLADDISEIIELAEIDK